MKDPKLFADCYQASIQIFNKTKTFPKALRPCLGRRIEEATLDCLLHIKKAAVSYGEIKIQHLQNASDSLDELRVLIQFSKDMQILNTASFSEISGYTKEIGKELGGFIKYAKQKNQST